MGPKKRTAQTTAFDAPPVLTGKRKRATVSYVEAEGDADPTSNVDEDEAFTTGRKVCDCL
jgi:hypothetical protein